jgi:hypothetical protein
MGRTLLLDALLIGSPVGARDQIYRALLDNVNDVVNQDGVTFFSRHDGLIDLVRSGLIDPRSALMHFDDH